MTFTVDGTAPQVHVRDGQEVSRSHVEAGDDARAAEGAGQGLKLQGKCEDVDEVSGCMGLHG